MSVITVVLNDIKGLKRTVKTVVNQTCQDFEYIVVDGASTDGCKEYIAGVDRIDRWVSEPDTGIYNAMNKGIAMAKGDYCIFMNAGDEFYADTVLEEVVPQLKGDDFYVGRMYKIGENGKKLLHSAPPLPLTMFYMLTNAPGHQSTFTRTQLLKNSPYREDYRIISDWEKFFSSWYYHKATITPLDTIVSTFYMDGLSCKMQDLMFMERRAAMKDLVPERLINHVTCKEGFELKIAYALDKSPLQRDWKLIRNAFKYLIKDIFVALKP